MKSVCGSVLDFRQRGVDCEMIAYDKAPLMEVFGKSVEFLGIDVVHDVAESLLELPDCVPEEVKERLNENFLCQTAADVPLVCKACGHGDLFGLPCLVYRVKFL